MCGCRYFLGDETLETVRNFDKNLRPFRCPDYNKYVDAGKQHALRKFFATALEEAGEEERRAAQRGKVRALRCTCVTVCMCARAPCACAWMGVHA